MDTCGMCEGQLEHGYLCPGDTQALAERLQRIPQLYRALGAFLQPAQRGNHGGRTHPVDAPLPVDEHVLDLRGPGGMVTTLESWREALHDARRWPAPVARYELRDRVAAAAAGLQSSVDWIARYWPAAGDMAREIRDAHNAAASVVHPRLAEERGTRLGKCPAVDSSGAICGAILRHFPGQRAVTCKWCGCSFEPHEWAGLREWIDRDEDNPPMELAS
ncbi:hypothetical protein EAO71_20350 [Streptomyces sp. ms191]|uniref:hypothetical protein n=1 Tax=Streptomyces sp. ms191 TaxID=1827978 RepID=UPI0011CE2EED|nr:hypothetical protein [Streptomyces sp. ms191]TXS30747.1 hypothetical protein EAO71_20350 [Streptomyces sp. ms191]